ncbi:hypothetical protein [Rhodococcus sp. I2R]|jgi:hypothetical protein|uniref:hypothetical protein n=2 Tax=Bacteria TaxID=2 RepID=UPI001E4DF008|nr:hypothetical protein [Rhodococcus sp. I2R]MCC8928793.1 hypothetical protein [Rhodococcus sp. I2R]
MTAATSTDTVADRGPLPRWWARPAAVIVFRWSFLLGYTVAAFMPTWLRLAREASDGAITAYIFVLPLLAAVAAQGVARRRYGELPIHDRQTDNIVGGLALIVAVAVKALWMPRYADQYALAHLDVLSALVFFFGGSILLFGLRPVGRFWSVWLLLLTLSPFMYRLIAIGLGGGRFAYGSVLVLLAGLAGAIAVGRTPRRGWLGFLCTTFTGLALLIVVLRYWPTIDIVWLQILPTVGAAVATGSAFYVAARRGVLGERPRRRLAPSTAKWSLSSYAVVLAAAVVLYVIPLPPTVTVSNTVGPPGSTSVPLAAPTGWTRTDIEEFDWVRAFFGQSSTLVRERMRADEGNPTWDTHSRPRTVVVDVLSTTNRASLAVYPESTLYQLSGTRTSPKVHVALGHDVTGQLYTSVSEALLLSWTKLVFTWVRGAVTQRVTIISVDNHEDDAEFPQPRPSMTSNLGTSISTFLRGNAITTDANPEYKDFDLLTSFATALVRAQWLANPEAEQ